MTKKTIFISGSTDGIGLETAKKLLSLGHRVLLHGRDSRKLDGVKQQLSLEYDGSETECYVADLSCMSETEELAKAVAAKHQKLDVLINNAGVFKVPNPITPRGLDLRFAVNTLAPYLLTKRLLPILHSDSRVINLSSAAQATVDVDALCGKRRLDDGQAYAESKLALTMWSRHLALSLGERGPAIIAVHWLVSWQQNGQRGIRI